MYICTLVNNAILNDIFLREKVSSKWLERNTIDRYPIIETKQASELVNTPLQFPTMTGSLRQDACLMERNNITRVISQCVFEWHPFER